MKLEEFTRTRRRVKRKLDMPGNTLEEIWTNDIPKMWDKDEILVNYLEYQIKIKNIFR